MSVRALRVRLSLSRFTTTSGLALGAAGVLLASSAMADDPVQYPGNSHYYEVITVSNLGWSIANNAAAQRGGTLATATDAGEDAFILRLVLNTPGAWFLFDYRRAIGPWLGASQAAGVPEPGDGWTWVIAEPFSYTNWGIGQPDDDGLGEDFLHYSNLGTTLDGTWNDRALDDDNADPGYIVEYDSIPCPRIITQPVGLDQCPDLDAQFIVRAFSPFALSYQWSLDGIPLTNTEGLIEGADTPVLTIVGATDADEGLYDCTIANDCGDIATDAVRLLVGVPGDLSGSADPTDPAYGVPDGIGDAIDYSYFIDQFAAGNPAVADLTGSANPASPAFGIPDGIIDSADHFFFIADLGRGCPEPGRVAGAFGDIDRLLAGHDR